MSKPGRSSSYQCDRKAKSKQLCPEAYRENKLIHLLLFGNLSPSAESKFGNSISADIIVKSKVHYCLSHKRGSSPILKQHFND